MTHSYGYRRGTRKKFARPFQQHGTHKLKRFLTKYRIGDYVDVLVDGSQHKGLPFKYFHGRTGKVFNVNPKSLGVVLLKQVKHRFIEKRLNIRLDHLRKSNCREAFVKRVQANDKKKNEVN
jgi:large subunit ribosomal protein L21e